MNTSKKEGKEWIWTCRFSLSLSEVSVFECVCVCVCLHSMVLSVVVNGQTEIFFDIEAYVVKKYSFGCAKPGMSLALKIYVDTFLGELFCHARGYLQELNFRHHLLRLVYHWNSVRFIAFLSLSLYSHRIQWSQTLQDSYGSLSILRIFLFHFWRNYKIKYKNA